MVQGVLCPALRSFKLVTEDCTGCEFKASYTNQIILTCGQSCMHFKEKISFLEVMTFYSSVIFNLDFIIEPSEFSQGKDGQAFCSLIHALTFVWLSQSSLILLFQ